MMTNSDPTPETDCRIPLSNQDIRSLSDLLDEILARHSSVESPGFQEEVALYSHEMPRSLRAALHDFKMSETASALLIVSGWPVDQRRLGRTPPHWKAKPDRSPALEEEILLMLFGSMLGDCIGWSTQQDGRLVHEILPIQGNEHEQLGSGSEELLWWHCEDAFHPYRGDYLGMLCLRNPDDVPTTFASVKDLDLDPEDLELLFQPLYEIRPDESHLKKNKGLAEVDDTLESAYDRIEEMSSAPTRIAVLYGDPRAPYVRIDPFFMNPVKDHPRAQQALDRLIQALEEELREIVLEPGDFCFIDNFQAVHGRKPFKARYDGNDRWLKRINIARDLRKSRASRGGPLSRIIA